MTPKEKAKSMIDKYYSHLTDVLMNAEAKEFATVCSLLCAREVIAELNKLPSKDLSDLHYWTNVENEIDEQMQIIVVNVLCMPRCVINNKIKQIQNEKSNSRKK